VHFLTDNDSIGEAICKRAEALNASAVVMAKHQRGAIAEFFLGSGGWLPGHRAAPDAGLQCAVEARCRAVSLRSACFVEWGGMRLVWHLRRRETDSARLPHLR
jgi:hypothetical protein